MRITARSAAIGCFVVLGIFAAGNSAMAAQAKPAAKYEYSYFKQRIRLDINPEMVAVFIDDAQRDRPGAGNQADIFAAHGITEEMITPSTATGWKYVMTPRDRRADQNIEALLTELVDNDAADFVSPVFVGTGGNPVVITREVLIAFNPDVSDADAEALLAKEVPGEMLDRHFAGNHGLYRLRTNLRTAREVLDLVNGLAQNPAVKFAQSDTIYWAQRYGTAYIPNDPMFSQQWALNHVNDHDMNGPEAWAITTGDPNVVVVVLDSGAQQNHPDIHQTTGMTFTNSGTNGGPGGQCDNHATAVSGCVAGTIDNNIGVVGIAPGCTVRSGKIFNELFFLFFCTPFLESQDSWTVNGINWAVSIGARVTNSSWGGGTASAAITTAFNNAKAAGVVNIAAAGNDGTSTIGYPANLASVNAVSATNVSGNIASFSTYGAGLFASAPGEAVLTTDRTGGDGYGSGDTTTIDGTSFSSPYTCGVAALVISANPALTPTEVENIIASTAKDRGPAGYDTSYGWGIVDAHAAVVAAMPKEPACPADLAGNDDTVDVSDLFALLAAWGTNGPGADLAAPNNTIDVGDLFVLLAAWGDCP